MYFHSKPLYFYRKINQKGLFKFKGRVLDSPWSDDTVVQFWNPTWVKRYGDHLIIRGKYNMLIILYFSPFIAPHTHLFSKEFPKVSSCLYIYTGKSVRILPTNSDTWTSATPWAQPQVPSWVSLSFFSIITLNPMTCKLNRVFSISVLDTSR